MQFVTVVAEQIQHQMFQSWKYAMWFCCLIRMKAYVDFTILKPFKVGYGKMWIIFISEKNSQQVL